jgi:hypothetical protein
MITTPSYRLGAEELLELGAIRREPLRMGSRRPFFAGRYNRPMLTNSPELGQLQILGTIAGYLVDGLAFALNTLGDLIDLPLNILAQGVDVAFNGVAGLLSNIPVLGDLLSQIVLVGGSLIKFGLSVPGLLLHGLGNILEGIGEALDDAMTPSEKQKKLDDSKESILEKTPDDLKEGVKSILDAGGVGGTNISSDISRARETGEAVNRGEVDPNDPGSLPSGKSELEKVLEVGLPVAGAAALVLLVVS